MDAANGIKQTIIISLVIGLLAFAGGYFLGRPKLISVPKNNNSELKANNVKINSLSGTVKNINGGTISLALNGNASDVRTVETDSKTEIIIQEQKDPAQYQKELDEYLKKTQEQMSTRIKPGEISNAPIVSELSPEMFAKKAGSMADIKNGALITVVTAQDIKDAKQFKAAQIYIVPPPIAPNSVAIPPIK